MLFLMCLIFANVGSAQDNHSDVKLKLNAISTGQDYDKMIDEKILIHKLAIDAVDMSSEDKVIHKVNKIILEEIKLTYKVKGIDVITSSVVKFLETEHNKVEFQHLSKEQIIQIGKDIMPLIDSLEVSSTINTKL